MLATCVRDRDLLPASQSVDVRFGEFMADDISMVRRIYELAGQPRRPEVRAASMLDAPSLAGARREAVRLLRDRVVELSRTRGVVK